MTEVISVFQMELKWMMNAIKHVHLCKSHKRSENLWVITFYIRRKWYNRSTSDVNCQISRILSTFSGQIFSPNFEDVHECEFCFVNKKTDLSLCYFETSETPETCAVIIHLKCYAHVPCNSTENTHNSPTDLLTFFIVVYSVFIYFLRVNRE